MKTLKDKIENDILILCALSNDPTDINNMKFIDATENIDKHLKQAIKDLKEDADNHFQQYGCLSKNAFITIIKRNIGDFEQ